jgi:4-aminobutyrate aminotransferase/(S)-3-amino-2-methylpropionate transaminase
MLTGKELATVGKPAGAKTKELIDKKEKFVSKGISTGFFAFVDEAKGAVIKDLDGNTYIDFFAGIGVLNAGHCPEPVVKAIKDQADKLLHTCFMTIMYDSYVELAEKLCAITPGSFEKKALFVNSGAEADENAIKLSRAYTKRPAIVAFDSAFHGRTLLTMSLTSKVKPYKYGFGPFAPEIYKAPYAYCYRCPYGTTYPGCGMACLEYFDKFFKAEVDSENVAAMIVEPVQGEGGFVVPPKEFLPGLKKICEDKGIVFIADEIQTGFGRTGKMFAVENFGVEPDLISMAKSIASGMPLSAVVGKTAIMDSVDPGQVGGTYAGSPTACAAGVATLKILQEDNLADKAEAIGKKVEARMKKLQEKYEQIGDIRRLGAMIGVEFIKDAKTKEHAPEICAAINKENFKNGLMTIGAGIYGNINRMLIPLVITDEQLDAGLDIYEASINTVLGK